MSRKNKLGRKERSRLSSLLHAHNLEDEALPLDLLSGPFVISDPGQEDNPIVFASKAFLRFSGYERKEVEGRNCRFLQRGKNGSKDESGVEKIRQLIRDNEAGAVRLTNYRKNGEEFINSFYLMPLKDKNSKVVLFFGGQSADRDFDSAELAESISSKNVPSNVVYRTPGSSLSKPNRLSDICEWENEFSKGKVLVKTRTDPIDSNVAAYFDGKNRMFEYQLQFEILQPIPENHELYIGMEIDGSAQLGYGSRMVMSMLLGILRMFSSSVHHSYGGDSDDCKERAHIVFPFSVLPDNLIVCNKNEKSPNLTLGHLPEQHKAEIKSLECEKTYTLSFYSQYVDFERWVIVKVPGMRNTDLRNFWGESPLHVVAYSLPKECKSHDKEKRRLLLDVELIHSSLKKE